MEKFFEDREKTVFIERGPGGNIKSFVYPKNLDSIEISARVFNLLNKKTGAPESVSTYFISQCDEKSFEARWIEEIPLKIVVKKFIFQDHVRYYLFSDMITEAKLHEPIVDLLLNHEDPLLYDIGSKIWLKYDEEGRITKVGKIHLRKTGLVLNEKHVIEIRDKAIMVFEALETDFHKQEFDLGDLFMSFGFWLDNNGKIRDGEWILLSGLFTSSSWTLCPIQ